MFSMLSLFSLPLVPVLIAWVSPYLTTVLATVVVLGVLIFVHEFGHFLVAKLLGVRVEVFSLGFPPKLFSRKVGETEYRLSVVPLGGYVKLLGENPNDEVPPELIPRSFLHRPLWQRTAIVLAGPAFNFFFAVLALFAVFSLSGLPYLTTEVGRVLSGSPAERAQLKKGDVILTVDGVPVKRWDDLAHQIRQRGGKSVVLTLKRQDKPLEVRLTPEKREATNIFGQKVEAYQIGVASAERVAVETLGPLQALGEGCRYSLNIAALTLQSIYKLVLRELPMETLGGPIMIAQVAGRQAEMGFAYLIQFMAVLSVNLTLLNLLPVPILDGGHLMFFLLEAVRGKPLALKHRELAQAVGMMLILTLMLLVFYHDLMRLFGTRQ